MPRPLGHIRILLSARVLLNLEEADRIFKESGPAEYADYMRGRGKYEQDFDAAMGGRKIEKGPLWNVAHAMLELNKQHPDRLAIEIGVICKDTAETALPIFRNLDVQGLGKLEGRYALAGKAIAIEDHKAFGTDLLLTRNAEDAQFAVDNNIAAATLNFPPSGQPYERNKDGQIRIWVDGDAVTFGSSAELVYRKLATEEDGLQKYKQHEADHFNDPVEPGPFTDLLVKISQLNRLFPPGQEPFELSLLTARGAEAAARVFTIAENLGIEFNGRMVFVSGAEKRHTLEAHKPDFFFDDQQTHLKEGMHFCATGLVPYAKDSPMDVYTREQAAKQEAAQKFNDASGKKSNRSRNQTPANDSVKPKGRKSGNDKKHGHA